MTQPQDNPTQANSTNVRSASATIPVMMEARAVKKIYGHGEKSLAVLSDANLSLLQGEMVAIVAPSGAGKSTLLHLLAALDTPTSGTVYFANKAIETNDDAALAAFRNRAVGFLWQRHQLLPDFTAAVAARRGFHFSAGDGAEVVSGGWLGKSSRSPRRGTLRRGTAARRNSPGARHWAKRAAGR